MSLEMHLINKLQTATSKAAKTWQIWYSVQNLPIQCYGLVWLEWVFVTCLCNFGNANDQTTTFKDAKHYIYETQ